MVTETETTRHEEPDEGVFGALMMSPAPYIVVWRKRMSNAVADPTDILETVILEPVADTSADIDLATSVDWSDTYTARLQREVEQARRTEIEQKLEHLLWAAEDEEFEDGQASVFATDLERLVRRWGEEVIDVLAVWSSAERVRPSLFSEALISLGHLDEAATEERRFWLLADSLFHTSPEVRDAAGLGLASLGQPRATRYLDRAIAGESIAELRDELIRVASYLRSLR